MLPTNEPLKFAHIHRWLAEGRVVPFLGAGASIGDATDSLPSGRQLAHMLAERIGPASEEIDCNDLIEVATYYADLRHREHLEESLLRIFSRPRSPRPIHRALASLRCPFILTTNYDTLIEDAFREIDQPFHLLTTPVHERNDRGTVLWWRPGAIEPERHDQKGIIDSSGLPLIYKLHGGVMPGGRWQTSVITEGDYFEIGGRVYEGSLLPFVVAAELQSRGLMFLGHSLSDIHVRYMLNQWRARHDRLFLVAGHPSRRALVRLERIGINVILEELDDFVANLRKVADLPHDHRGGPAAV